jgi:hypothetical protein
VSFVVIAGDIYDGEWKDTSIGLFFNREVARLDRTGIRVFVLKGNHDAESVVTRAISLPGNVFQFPTKPKTVRIEELEVALHGRSFSDRAMTENIVLDYPDPVPGWFNIGVLHTSCEGRPGHANYAPCTVSQLKSLGYQYWALGHVHEYEELGWDPWIVFPGNLQGRSIRECGPKGAVLVDVDDGRVTAVRRLIVDDVQRLFGETGAYASNKADLPRVRAEADEYQGFLTEFQSALAMLENEEQELEREMHETFAAHSEAVRRRAEAEQGMGAEVAVQQRSSAEAELIATSREWLVLKFGALLVTTAIDRRRADESDPLLTRASFLFAMLTGNSFSGMAQEFDEHDVPRLVGRRPTGEAVKVSVMSTGARDQFYLALRLAYLEEYASRSEPAPFIGDDLFASFDENRTANGLAALAAIGDRVQPIVFTPTGTWQTSLGQ